MRSLQAGDAFDASQSDAAVLKAVGRAIDAPVTALRTRALEPESETASPDEPTPEQPRTKRQYRRRDLTAESS